MNFHKIMISACIVVMSATCFTSHAAHKVVAPLPLQHSALLAQGLKGALAPAAVVLGCTLWYKHLVQGIQNDQCKLRELKDFDDVLKYFDEALKLQKQLNRRKKIAKWLFFVDCFFVGGIIGAIARPFIDAKKKLGSI